MHQPFPKAMKRLPRLKTLYVPYRFFSKGGRNRLIRAWCDIFHHAYWCLAHSDRSETLAMLKLGSDDQNKLEEPVPENHMGPHEYDEGFNPFTR